MPFILNHNNFLLISIILIISIIIIFPKFLSRNEKLNNVVGLSLISLLLLNIYNLIVYYIDNGSVRLTLVKFSKNLTVEFVTEPLGLIFAALAAMLWLATYCYSIGYMSYKNSSKLRKFYRFMALSMGCVFAIAFAGNLFTLFIFYELLTIFTYPLISFSGEKEAKKAGQKYLTILLFASLSLLLPAIVATYYYAGHLEFQHGGILSGKISNNMSLILLALYIFGVAKTAILPMHSWLPAAMIAPTPVSALLHAVAVVKVGIFTILKVIIYIFGIHFISKWGGMLICICAAITILISSIICLKQDNLKRLLAYSTISQLSYCLLAASIMTPKAIIAAVLHMISHAVAKIVLFFSAGCFYTATYKTSIKETAGLGKEMPIVGLCFTICALSILGVPPLIGFFSKLYILSAAHSLDNVSLIVIVVILISTVLNAAYFIPVIYNLWWEKKLDHEELVVHKEIPFSMILPIIMITLIASLLFLFGNRLIKFIEMII